MASANALPNLYSIVIAVYPEEEEDDEDTLDAADANEQDYLDDWRRGDIVVDWIDFTKGKLSQQSSASQQPSTSDMSLRAGEEAGPSGSIRKKLPRKSIPCSATSAATQDSPPRRRTKGGAADPDALSMQPLLAHFPGPNPLGSAYDSGVSHVGRGVIHLFRHAPPAPLIASLDAHPIGESSSSVEAKESEEWAGERAEGEDGSLVAILAVPAWMRPADFLEFIGGWSNCLEGVRMIREATTPNRSIVLLKFRDPLQASDFMVIFTGRAFSTLDSRETCHPIRIHHLVLHRFDTPANAIESQSTRPVAIPAFPSSVYASRVRELPELLRGVSPKGRYELPSCPVCLERLDSSVTGLVTLPCAHTFDCDCLRKWGDSRCPVCRVSHLLLSHTQDSLASPTARQGGPSDREAIMRLTKCSICGLTENNWICVVCGVVGCGRYDPGKGHARRHWEESGHVLAMELETQRVWDYQGDNYVHRLIQSRNDGKLVELPSASSLTTHAANTLRGSDGPRRSQKSPSSATPASQPTAPATARAQDTAHSSDGSPQAGPTSDDIDKISTIEAITLEYSYLLSSQLEAMRQHYETDALSTRAKLKELESAEARARAAEAARQEAEKAREKAERKAEKAAEVTRALQANLLAEKAMSEGLSTRVHTLQGEISKIEQDRKAKTEEVKTLEETVRDLMFNFEASAAIQASGGADTGEGGDLVIVDKKKKNRRK